MLRDDTSNIKSMNSLFQNNTQFDKDISNWNIPSKFYDEYVF